MPHFTRKGMDWIRLHKRMSLYHRDGHDCAWCRGVFPLRTDGYGLTLDHVWHATDNRATNLVTACGPCNSARKQLGLDDWLAVLGRRGHDPREVLERVESLTQLPLDVAVGYQLAVARRPNYRVAGVFTNGPTGSWSRRAAP